MRSRVATIVTAGAAVALALLWGGQRVSPMIGPAVTWVHHLGPLGPVLFILLYGVAVIALIPSSWMTMAGGAVFGIAPAAAYALVGATWGSTAAFLLGRHAARRVVADHLDAMPRFNAIDRAVAREGRRIIFLLRLSPVAPFNFLNYALGLTTISVWDFLAGSLGMIPGALLYAYAGNLAGQALALAGKAQMPRNASYYAMFAAGLVATIAASAIATRAARRALRDV